MACAVLRHQDKRIFVASRKLGVEYTPASMKVAWELDNLELYTPRPVTKFANWNLPGISLKVYGIHATGREISDDILAAAKDFAINELPDLIKTQGEDNGMGFVIIHPGEQGLSVLLHWWIQGSVLCQHIRRQLWDADYPLNNTNRSVLACVWELGLINAEQLLWRDTMMSTKPDPEAYMSRRASMQCV